MSDTHMLLDIYLRLSDLRQEDMNDQGQSKGLAFHEKELQEYASRLGARVGKVIVENDIKEGRPKPASAWKRKTITLPNGKKVKRVVRPGFTELLRRMESKQSGGFLAVDLDRAVRDPYDLEEMIDVIRDSGANVRSISGSMTFTDGGNSSEEFQARVLLSAAKKASDDTSRRVAMARKRQADAGEWGGGKRPYGFKPDGITIDEMEAAVILNCTRAVLAGASLRSLTQDLRDRKVPTVKGGPWTPSSLKDILCRPRNAGIKVYAGQELLDKPAPWKPIVPLDEFRAVVARLQVRKASPGRAPRWLGSGIYYCSCGGRVSAHNQQTRTGRYRCKDTGLMGGDHTSRDIGKLDKYVVNLIVDWCAQPVASQRLVPVEEVKFDVEALRAESVALRQRLKDKARDNFDRKITDDQLEIFTELTNERLTVIDQQLAQARRVTPMHDLVGAGEGEGDLNARRERVRAEWETSSLSARREIVKELMTVKLLPARRGKVFDPSSIEITWNL